MLNGGVSQFVPKCPVLSRFVPFVLFCPDLSPFRAPRRTNGTKRDISGQIGKRPHLASTPFSSPQLRWWNWGQRKSSKNASFRGKRHDNSILKVQLLLSRNVVVIAQAPNRDRTSKKTALNIPCSLLFGNFLLQFALLFGGVLAFLSEDLAVSLPERQGKSQKAKKQGNPPKRKGKERGIRELFLQEFWESKCL